MRIKTTSHGGRRRRLILPLIAVATLVLASCGSKGSGENSSASDYPNQPLEFIVTSGAGGGADIFVRTIAQILDEENIYTEPISVVNMEGGGASRALTYVKEHAGDPYVISHTTTSALTTPLQAETSWKISDFAPVALLGTDDMLLLVPGDSPHETYDDFVAAAKTKAPKIGGTNVASTQFLLSTMLSEQSGFEMDYVAFDAQGEVMTALSSGSIDAIAANPGEIAGQLASGDVKPLGFSGETAPASLGDVPTFASMGLDTKASNPRGVILPPDTDPAVVTWWENAMKQVVETDAWKKYVEDNSITPTVLYGADFEKFLTELSANFERILKEAGAI
jgi:putative tricarboxylic transport membrane protein